MVTIGRPARAVPAAAAVLVAVLLTGCGTSKSKPSPVAGESAACAASAAASRTLDGSTQTTVKLFQGGPRVDVSVSGSTVPFVNGSAGIARRLADQLAGVETDSAGDPRLPAAVAAIRALGDAANRSGQLIENGNLAKAGPATAAFEHDGLVARRLLRLVRAPSCRSAFDAAGARTILPRLAIGLTCATDAAPTNAFGAAVAALPTAAGRLTRQAIVTLEPVVAASARSLRQVAGRLRGLEAPVGQRPALDRLVAGLRDQAGYTQRFASSLRRVAAGGQPLANAVDPASLDAAVATAAKQLGVGYAGC